MHSEQVHKVFLARCYHLGISLYCWLPSIREVALLAPEPFSTLDFPTPPICPICGCFPGAVNQAL